MNASAHLDRLLDAGVLEPTGDGSLRLTDVFQRNFEDRRRAISGDDGDEPANFMEPFEQGGLADSVGGLCEANPDLAATVVTVADALDAAGATDVLGTALALHQFVESPARADGTPGGFLPVRGEDLPHLLPLFEFSIVYVWREDCPPCETVRAEHEAIADQLPDGVARLAVYGPAAARTLHEAYGVEGAPVTLFTVGDRVDVRLVGVHEAEQIASEIETTIETTRCG